MKKYQDTALPCPYGTFLMTDNQLYESASREQTTDGGDRILHQNAVQLLLERPDKTYSLCDSVSFVVMGQFGITEALTTDRHFEQEGFIRLLEIDK